MLTLLPRAVWQCSIMRNVLRGKPVRRGVRFNLEPFGRTTTLLCDYTIIRLYLTGDSHPPIPQVCNALCGKLVRRGVRFDLGPSGPRLRVLRVAPASFPAVYVTGALVINSIIFIQSMSYSSNAV